MEMEISKRGIYFPSNSRHDFQESSLAFPQRPSETIQDVQYLLCRSLGFAKSDARNVLEGVFPFLKFFFFGPSASKQGHGNPAPPPMTGPFVTLR